MTNDQFITVRETAQLLGVSEKKIMDLVQENKLRAYKIADQFLRLKKTEVLGLKNDGAVEAEDIKFEYTPSERVQDFFYYNDFYLVTFGIMAALIYLIFFLN